MLTPRKVARYGWRPDFPDLRDHLFRYSASKPTTVADKISLRSKMPPVFDQGQLGSCTANALCGAVGFLHPGFVGSRLQVYYGERQIEGDISQDGGAQIRDGVKVLNKTGVGPESEWPYVEANFAKKPPSKEIKDAGQHKITSYSRLTTADDFKKCLTAGFPFVLGFTVYESFESDDVAKSGVVPMPTKNEGVAGGHAVVCIGYDSTRSDGMHYECRNSWSADWGDAGNFWMPAAYMESKLVSDVWTLRA